MGSANRVVEIRDTIVTFDLANMAKHVLRLNQNFQNVLFFVFDKVS
jgi:hypothetical protein